MTLTETAPFDTKNVIRADFGGSIEFRADEQLPPGICGRVRGIALVYNEIDTKGTMFAPGCLTRTAAERVPAGKVKLFADHGPFTHTHVGYVRRIFDTDTRAMFEADLFDTEAGRSMKEYLSAVIAAGAQTGASVGFKQRTGKWAPHADGTRSWLFTEVMLAEISITPANSVDGTDILSVRSEDEDEDEEVPVSLDTEEIMFLKNMINEMRSTQTAQNGQGTSETSETSEELPSENQETRSTQPEVVYMSLEDRITAVRLSITL